MSGNFVLPLTRVFQFTGGLDDPLQLRVGLLPDLDEARLGPRMRLLGAHLGEHGHPHHAVGRPGGRGVPRVQLPVVSEQLQLERRAAPGHAVLAAAGRALAPVQHGGGQLVAVAQLAASHIHQVRILGVNLGRYIGGLQFFAFTLLILLLIQLARLRIALSFFISRPGTHQ